MIMKLPNSKSVKDVLEGMLGRDVTLDAAVSKMSPVDAVGGLVATYCDDDSQMRAILGWSIEAAAYVGCSLGLIPAGMAKEMAAEKYLRTDAVENLAEVSNVMAAAFDRPGNPHVRMDQTYFPTGSAPQPLTSFMFSHSDRLDYELTIKGYGVGKMTLVACT
jgi:hypothetical protein